MSPRPIVVLSVCGPEDFYFVHLLRQKFNNIHLIKISDEESPKTNWHQGVRRWLRRPLSHIYYWFEQLFYELHAVYLEHATKKALAARQAAVAIRPDAVICADNINSQIFADELKKLQPEFIVVSGGPILKPLIFNQAQRACINVHHGVAPWYRGGYTLFWPLFFRDYDRIGVTVHLINEGIDSGSLLAYGICPLDQHTTEAGLTVAAVELAAKTLIPILATPADHEITGMAQQQKGRLFRYGDRRPWHDLVFWLRRKLLRESPPEKPSRVELLYGTKQGVPS